MRRNAMEKQFRFSKKKKRFLVNGKFFLGIVRNALFSFIPFFGHQLHPYIPGRINN